MLPLILKPSCLFVIWKAETGGWWEICKSEKRDVLLQSLSVYLTLSLTDTHTHTHKLLEHIILEVSSYLFSKVKCSTVSFGVLPKTSEGFSNNGIIWLLESLVKTKKTTWRSEYFIFLKIQTHIQQYFGRKDKKKIINKNAHRQSLIA